MTLGTETRPTCFSLTSPRYYELKPHDVFSFGESTRDYVLLFDELVGKKTNSP
jgi:hypothetical protein